MPDMYNLVVNTNNELIGEILIKDNEGNYLNVLNGKPAALVKIS